MQKISVELCDVSYLIDKKEKALPPTNSTIYEGRPRLTSLNAESGMRSLS
jgi:hypothetical protein